MYVDSRPAFPQTLFHLIWMHMAYTNLNSNKKVSRFVDLEKLFNLYRHDYLLTDLELAGIKGHVLNWF